jgi:DoxX-like family
MSDERRRLFRRNNSPSYETAGDSFRLDVNLERTGTSKRKQISEMQTRTVESRGFDSRTAAFAANSPSSGQLLRIGLWTAQTLIFLAFGAAGLMKLLTPIVQLAGTMPWAGQLPQAFVRAIALIDLIGGVGILLPALVRCHEGEIKKRCKRERRDKFARMAQTRRMGKAARKGQAI